MVQECTILTRNSSAEALKSEEFKERKKTLELRPEI